MAATDGWAPRDIDTSTPSTARMYDYYLGGKDNFPVDRDAAARVLEFAPDVRQHARDNRRFLQEAVRYMAGQGVRQFIDIGTGVPTQGPVHEVAHEQAPDARVVYVDHDPVVLAHARALMQHGSDGVTVIEADMLDPDQVLSQVDSTGLIDFREPVAVLFIAVLHFVTDNPGEIVAKFRARMVSGSYLAITHATMERDPEGLAEAKGVYDWATSSITPRPRADIRALFDGFEPIDPGVTAVARWRPGDASVVDDPNTLLVGGLGRRS